MITQEERHDTVEAIKDAFRGALRLKRAALACILLPVLVGCSPVMVAGSLGSDAGTFGVSGIGTGIGGQLELIAYRKSGGPGSPVSRRWNLGPALQLAGYSAQNDADPQGFATLDVRYRRPFRPSASSGPYWEAGTGGGVAWSAGIRAAAVPLQGEIGVQRQMGAVLLSAGLRERFLALVGTGSPPWDAFNSVQIVVGVRFGRER